MSIEQYTPSNGTVAPAPDAPANNHVTDLQQWAQQAQAASLLAENLCSTTFVPQQYRGKTMEAAAAILAGAELGFSPMAALRTFDNIQGTAAPKAITHRAVVQAQGHQIWVVEQTDERAVVHGRRKGSSEVVESVWTIDRAKGLGLTSKDNWKKQPQAMLVARATSECARFVASDALLGMPYSAEELRDDPGLTVPSPDEQNAAPTPQRAARGKTATTVDDLTGTPAPVDVSGGEEMSTKAQRDRLGATFAEANVMGRNARLRIVGSLSDRDVSSAADLTKAEASALLEHLAELGSDGIAALANPDDANPGYIADPASDPWAGEQGTLGGDQ